jgi:hypothetical protein
MTDSWSSLQRALVSRPLLPPLFPSLVFADLHKDVDPLVALAA